MRAPHDGAGGEARVAVAMATPENAGAIGKAVWLARRAAVVTDESISPSGALAVDRARRFVRKQSLEFWKRARKRQVVSLKHVDNHGCHTLEQMPNMLPVVCLGDSPISTISTLQKSGHFYLALTALCQKLSRPGKTDTLRG